MKTIPLQHILDMAPNRPTGYVAECLSLGRRTEDNMIEFDDETYLTLVAKYRVPSGDPTATNCCG